MSIFFSLNWSTLARDIETPEEALRISGYADHLQADRAAEKLRLSQLQEHKKKNMEWEELKIGALQQYQEQKKQQAKTVDEVGPEYRQYLQDRLKEERLAESERRNFIKTKVEHRQKNKQKVQLSEEEELKIYEKSARVDWDKRKFFNKVADGNRPGAVNSGGAGGEYFPPPPPPPNTPGYFESEMPPPPPPPPLPYEPTYDNEIPPPPPPPMFDDYGGF